MRMHRACEDLLAGEDYRSDTYTCCSNLNNFRSSHYFDARPRWYKKISILQPGEWYSRRIYLKPLRETQQQSSQPNPALFLQNFPLF